MEKKRVSVQIEGRNYTVITTEDEAYVLRVAEEVSGCIRKAAQSSHNFDTRDCAVLAAMDFCDDWCKSELHSRQLVDKADQIIRQSAELSKQCREYKEKLAASINENTALTKRIKALEEQLRVALRENERLKSGDSKTAEREMKFDKAVRDKKTEKLMGYVPMRQYSLFEEGSASGSVAESVVKAGSERYLAGAGIINGANGDKNATDATDAKSSKKNNGKN